MKSSILYLFAVLMIIKYSFSTNTQTDKKEANAIAEDADSEDADVMSKLGKTMAIVRRTATVALALQSVVSPAFGSRMPPAASANLHQGTGIQQKDQQIFVPKIPTNMDQIAYKELHGGTQFEHGIEVPKMTRMENDGNAVQFSPSGRANGRRPFDPTKEQINPLIYPMAPRSNVTYNYSGTIVPDPYSALEEPDAKATKEFVAKLNNISQPYLEASPVREKLHKTLTNLWNYEKSFTPSFYGGYYYYYRNIGLQNQRVLYQAKSLDDEGKVFLDPNKLSKDGTTALTQQSFSADGTLFAYAVSEKGSELVTIKFKKCTGEDLPDQIHGVTDEQTELAWLNDNSGLFYSKYPSAEHSGTDTLEYHSLYFHRMGTDSKQDILVVQRRDRPELLIYGQVSEDGHFLFVTTSDNGPNKQLFYYDLAAVSNKIEGLLSLKPLFDKFDADYEMMDSDKDSALIFTNKDAPMYKLVRVSLNSANGTNDGGDAMPKQQMVIPEDPKRTMRFAYPVDGDKLLVCYLDNVQDALSVHALDDGQLLYKLSLPIGSVIMDSSISNEDDIFAYKLSSKVFFKIESFVLPYVIFQADFAECATRETPVQLKEFRRGKVPGLDLNAFAVKQVFFTSKDGTRVPMFITHHKDMVLDGKNPLLLSGYGGFGDSMLPSFSVSDLMFIQHFGGVTALPNIRGGNEYGAKWHEAGMREHKQNVFDDFIAAAEFLICEKYTSSNKLAIYGASNGGLLTAVCSQRRPELFGAVITQLGVLDMLRFNKFTVGSDWVAEYGNPENSHDFTFLYKYSPLHQLKLMPNRQWPATLLMSADHDDLVVPAHTLKYVAQLYYLLRTKAQKWQRNPVLAQIAVDEGHKVFGRPTSKTIDEKVNIFSFVQRVLGLEWVDRE